MLLAVPNISEGRDPARVARIGAAFAPGRLLDTHTDPDHHRSVFTLAGHQGELAEALLNGARAAVEEIDLRRHRGLHPRVGAIDVAPVVHLSEADFGAAAAEALTAAGLIAGELELPVFLYGALAQGRERADIRRGGRTGLAVKVEAGELIPDLGKRGLHPSAGAVLITARPPLVAFNVDIDTDDVGLARRIAAEVRRMPGVKAIGLGLEARGRAQVSTNIEDWQATSPAEVVEAVRALTTVVEAELVGLAPRTAFDGFPADVPLRGLRTIEAALGPAGDKPLSSTG